MVFHKEIDGNFQKELIVPLGTPAEESSGLPLVTLLQRSEVPATSLLSNNGLNAKILPKCGMDSQELSMENILCLQC